MALTAALNMENSNPEIWPEEAAESGAFVRFTSLPAELRIKIWQHTFEPRVLELHSNRGDHGASEESPWRSNCGNPVALSVSQESRAEALLFYTVGLPLGNRNGDPVSRRLYLNPSADTLALLGDIEFKRLRHLLHTVALLDPEGTGLQRLGFSLTNCAHGYARDMLQLWSNHLFGDIEQFMLLMYTESLPPANFLRGECVLQECHGMDGFLRLTMGHGFTLRPRDDWMVVGKTEMSVMYLNFISGKWTR